MTNSAVSVLFGVVPSCTPFCSQLPEAAMSPPLPPTQVKVSFAGRVTVTVESSVVEAAPSVTPRWNGTDTGAPGCASSGVGVNTRARRAACTDAGEPVTV